MYKEVIYSSNITFNNRNYRTIYPVYPGNSNCFTKIAEAGDLDPEVKNFISGINPNPDYIYVVAVALGAGESWSSNTNGDWFSREDLIKNHHTFVQNGKVYHLHDNKPNSKSFGEVLFSRFNPVMDRVELVFTISKKEMPDVCASIENGETIDVSMGTKVDFDVCSICGKKSKRFSEYCAHLKYEMNKIYPDGRKVFALNPNPKFFDISIVDIGADRTAKILAKVASANKTKIIHSAALGEKISTEKSSVLDKYSPVDPVERSLPEKLRQYWLAIGKYMDAVGGECDLRDLSKEYEINDILDLVTDNDILLRPYEFISFILDKLGDTSFSDYIFNNKISFYDDSDIPDDSVIKIHQDSGSLPIELPNKYTIERKLSPNSVTLRFRLIAGDMGKFSSNRIIYTPKSVKTAIDKSIASMYKSYIKQATKKLLKKANMELIDLIPKVVIMSMIGKIILEESINNDKKSKSDVLDKLIDDMNKRPPTMVFRDSNVLGIPLSDILKDSNITQSQLEEAAMKQVEMIDKIRRGGDPEILSFDKVSMAALAPMHILSTAGTFLKLSGCNESSISKHLSKISPASTALCLLFKKSHLGI